MRRMGGFGDSNDSKGYRINKDTEEERVCSEKCK